MKSDNATRPNRPSPDEQTLVRLAKSGDAEAFARLYDAYVERIYRYVYLRVADDATAEDLTSQVFLRAWEHLDRYRSDGVPFLAWLYTIARNAVIDHYRTNRRPLALDEIAQSEISSEGPEEQVDLRFEIQTLRAALKHLTDEQQQVLILKFIAGMSTDEVARQMGKHPGAIRALQMRALRALAKHLQEESAT